MRKPTEFESFPKEHGVYFGPYRAYCSHVIDGDTIDVSVDLGFNTYRYITVRVANIDTPEIFGRVKASERELGMACKRHVEKILLHKHCVVVTEKDQQTFGRYVADVSFLNEHGEEVSLRDSLRDFMNNPL